MSKSPKYWNLQKFVSEIFQVQVGLSPELMNDVFKLIENRTPYE